MDRIDLDLGTRLVPYAEGRELQGRLHAEVAAGARPATLLLLEHESVYTVGRRARSWERPDGEVVEPGRIPVVAVDRGGRTTWHGPGQLTIYPIVRLASPIDVIAYVRALEAAVIEVCAAYGLEAARVEGRSGVWLPAQPHHPRPAARSERKICALGVRVARGTTLHGLGLNVDPDLSVFDLDRIIPCGITDAGVTSLAAETGRSLSTGEPADAVCQALDRRLSPLVADATDAQRP